MKEHENKYRKDLNECSTGILMICYLITFILIIVWLFKIHGNAKSEPKLRSHYIIEEPSTYYREDEFCYEKYEPFLAKGALDTFDIPMSKLRKFCKALISTSLISIGSIILMGVFVLIGKNKILKQDLFMCFGLLFYTFFYLGFILSIIFAIILMHYYSKGDYSDFEEFSRCRYLSRQFKKNYDFVFNMKNEYKMPYAIIIITEIFNFVKLVAESNPNDNNGQSQNQQNINTWIN